MGEGLSACLSCIFQMLFLLFSPHTSSVAAPYGPSMRASGKVSRSRPSVSMWRRSTGIVLKRSNTSPVQSPTCHKCIVERKIPLQIIIVSSSKARGVYCPVSGTTNSWNWHRINQ